MGSLFRKPKKQRAPEPTAQELSLSRRQDEALSREIEEENRRKKSILRGTLGNKSLLRNLGDPSQPSGLAAPGGVKFAGATVPKTSTKSTTKSTIGPRSAPKINFANLNLGSLIA